MKPLGGRIWVGECSALESNRGWIGDEVGWGMRSHLSVIGDKVPYPNDLDGGLFRA